MSTAAIKGPHAGSLEQHGFHRAAVFDLIRHLGITEILVPVSRGHARGFVHDVAEGAMARGCSIIKHSAEDAPLADYLLDFRRRPPAYWGPYHILVRDWLKIHEPGMLRKIWF